MNLSYFKTFVSVVEKKSFSQAAKDLNLTQPAVSFQIQALEKTYQETFINRIGPKIKLTEAGKIFLAHAKKILEAEQRLKDELNKLEGKVTGTLTIGASNIPGEYILPRLLGRFKQLHPQLKVELEVSDTSEIVEKLNQHLLDIGFIGSIPEKSNLKIEKFYTDELVLIFPPTHHFAQAKKIALKDILKEPFIIREEGSGTRKNFEKGLKEKGKSLKDLNIVMELGSTQATISAVQAGLGISVISKLALSNLGKVLKSSRISDLNLKRDLYLAYNEKEALSYSQKEFIRFALKERV